MRLLTARHAGRPEHWPEEVELFAERRGALLVLHLEDGDTLELDAVELRAVLDEPRAHIERAA